MKNDYEKLMLQIGKASLSNTEISDKISEKIIRLYKYSILLESGKCSDYERTFESFLLEYSEYIELISEEKWKIEFLHECIIDLYKYLILERLYLINKCFKKSAILNKIDNEIKSMSKIEFQEFLKNVFNLNDKIKSNLLENIDTTEFQNIGDKLDKELISNSLIDSKHLNNIKSVERDKIYSDNIYDMEYRVYETLIYRNQKIDKYQKENQKSLNK